MNVCNDEETMQRATRLRELIAASLRDMTPQERDRSMQVHMAQARGPVANAYLVRQAINFAVRIRATVKERRLGNDR